MHLWILLASFCVPLNIVLSQEDKNPCRLSVDAQESCSGCIATAKQCAWCAQEVKSNKSKLKCQTKKPRKRCYRLGAAHFYHKCMDFGNGCDYLERKKLQCDTYENHVRGQCPTQSIQYPGDLFRILENQALTIKQDGVPAVHIRPQRVELRMRPSNPMLMNLVFRRATNHLVEGNLSKVKLRTENVADNIKVEIFSRCSGLERKKTDECGDLKIGQEATFELEVTVTECPKKRRKWKQEFFVKGVGYQDQLTVHLDIICECECEKNVSRNSPKCSGGSGNYQCGMCDCHPGYYGMACECESDFISSEESIQQCKGPNSTQVCSDRGECICGHCKCNHRSGNSQQRFHGTFCECDDYSCSRHNDQLCGGPQRGACFCGECMCKDGYNGIACECELSQEKCTTASGRTCNDHGTCLCGECQCDDNYSGPTCEECLTCAYKCDEYSVCIRCRLLGDSQYSKECAEKCPDTLPDTKTIEESPGVRRCKFKDDEKGVIEYSYTYNERGQLYMEYEKPKVSPGADNASAVMRAIIPGIVVVGLLLLLI